MTYALWILAALFALTGIIGTFLPLLPGVPLVFLGMILAAWAGHFEKVGAFTLMVLGLLTVLSIVFDTLATAWGAKRFGASRKAIIGAFIGTVVGIFFSVPGLILGPFAGAAAGEYLHRRDIVQAGKTGLGTWLGIVVSIGVRVALVFAMLGIFAAAYLF
ncbi:MAG: DUF456 family protein [Fibrobacterota bacterium]